jgi:hypothetical protein
MNGIRRAIALCLLVGGSLILAGQVATATTPVRFGAVLNNNLFPDNAYQGQTCDHTLTGATPGANYSCTWIEDSALNFNGNGFVGARAPKDGTINKIRLVSGVGGSFKLYLARYKTTLQQGKIIKGGQTVTYATDACNPSCHIQTISINPMQVHKGDVLAIKTSKTSTLRCDSGGDHISLYNPPLAVGGAFTNTTGTDGCYLMLQAQYQ